MNRTDVAAVLAGLIDDHLAAREEPFEGTVTGETPLLELMDSMGLVTLLADLEDEVDDRTGAVITIADERAMSASRSPFGSVDALTEYVTQLIEEARVVADA